ncbi:ArnT family glycosyltransferase [Granulicella mallensis]|nr:glycosyltransferase family 39 protein [Granulicella mallensis]
MTYTTPDTIIVRPADPTLREALRLAAIFAAIKLLLHFALTLWTQHLGYSYFRDEFYYIVCGRHLAWGYVDQGPIVAVQARLGELLFGDSLFAIRILSALAGAVAVFLTGLLTWALGGRRSAQGLAMLGILVAPCYLAIDSFLSMNSFEPMFWVTCILAIVMMLRGHSQRTWWIVLGISAGLGLLNKPSMVFILVSLGLGLLLTPQRRLLFTWQAALGIVLMFVIVAPNVLWQAHYHWPLLEFLHNGKVGHKTPILGPLAFFGTQITTMHPLTVFLWIPGLIALLKSRSLPNCRWLGFAAVLFFALLLLMHAKDYYVVPIYPALFAAGAIAWERYFASRSFRSPLAIPLYETLLLITGILILPMAIPVLAPDTWIRYTTAMHLHADKLESAETGPLPQLYADRFGWQQEADAMVRAYRSLSPTDQKNVCLFGNNYGEAGAIDFLGKQEEPNLPPAISPHNNYWMWGPHGCTGQLLIAVSDATPEQLTHKFEDVTIVEHMDNPFAMPFEHKTVYLLRNRKPGVPPFDWAAMKFYF